MIVNRLWQHHFGRGIVATPSDFGTMGEAPSHPELLDWLATELVARGWSLKAMHRLMVTSATYRQSTRPRPAAQELDPENTLLWRQNRRRLDGEAIRDALLAVSGRLNPQMGGPCVFPELPAELTKLSSKGAIWPVSPRAEDRNRRSLYVFVRRNLRYPFFEAFDRPDTNASCPRRAVTTIAPQALTLLNGREAHDAARALAARVAREAGPEPDARIDRAYLLALGRRPDDQERTLARAVPRRRARRGARRLLPGPAERQRVRLHRLRPTVSPCRVCRVREDTPCSRGEAAADIRIVSGHRDSGCVFADSTHPTRLSNSPIGTRVARGSSICRPRLTPRGIAVLPAPSADAGRARKVRCPACDATILIPAASPTSTVLDLGDVRGGSRNVDGRIASASPP